MSMSNGKRPSGLKMTEILRSEIARLQRALQQGQAVFQQLESRTRRTEQILATALFHHHPDGLTITEKERVACEQATMFQLHYEFVASEIEDEGSVNLSVVPLTEEQIKARDEAATAPPKPKGPDLILPPGARG